MDIRHLSVFVAVAQEGSFTRAAERLLLAQSAVSTTVRELERDLGVALFDRSHRQIRLTGPGEDLLPRAIDIVERLRGLRESAAAAAGVLRGTVTMGLMTAVTLVDVPAILGRFHEAHPEVTVALRAAGRGTSDLIAQLEHGEIDVALLATGTRLAAGLVGEVVASSPFVLVVPDGHRLAGRERVGLADLAGESFVDVPPGYASRAIVDAAVERAGVERTVLIEVAEIDTVAAYVRRGLGVALVPAFAAAAAPGTRIVATGSALPPFRVHVATSVRRVPLPATAALIALIRELSAR